MEPVCTGRSRHPGASQGWDTAILSASFIGDGREVSGETMSHQEGKLRLFNGKINLTWNLRWPLQQQRIEESCPQCSTRTLTPSQHEVTHSAPRSFLGLLASTNCLPPLLQPNPVAARPLDLTGISLLWPLVLSVPHPEWPRLP